MRTALIVFLTIATPAVANPNFIATYEKTTTHAQYFNDMANLGDHCRAADRAISIRGNIERDLIYVETRGSIYGDSSYSLDAEDVTWLKMQLSIWNTRAEQQKLQCK